MKKNILYCALPCLLLFCFCAESDGVIRQKLDVILKDDLEAILEDVAGDALLDKPYFELLEYREYDEGAYSRMAIADFYFLKSVGKKIKRKYRYHRRLGMWDRYHNQYYTIAPDENGTDN
jgi:hypothetical protein